MFSMEGMAMSVRNLMLGAAAMSMATLAAAEPAKPEPVAPQAANRPAEVVLASADHAVASVPAVQEPMAGAETPAAPVKKRAARVTTCRCADQPVQR